MNFNNTQEKEFEIDLKLYKKLVCEKGYKLPTPPIAMIKATAALDQKRRFKNHFLNRAGIYGWIDLQSSFCYVGSSVRLHIRPWQHMSIAGSSNQNLKRMLKEKQIQNFVLVIFEILPVTEIVTASLLEFKENLYLQEYIPKNLLFNILPFAYTNLGFKHTEKTKKEFSLMRKGKKGKKRPEITGHLHPIYGITNKRNPFFGKKHLKENIQKISDAGKLKIGLKNSRASPVMIQEIESGKYSIFATKTEAANFLGITKANTVTQYIKKGKIFQNKWLCLSITREKYNKILQDKNSFEI